MGAGRRRIDELDKEKVGAHSTKGLFLKPNSNTPSIRIEELRSPLHDHYLLKENIHSLAMYGTLCFVS